MKEPKFQRRHYEVLAAVMRDCHPGDSYSWWRVAKTKLGDALAEDNPRFDRGRFEEACEP